MTGDIRAITTEIQNLAFWDAQSKDEWLRGATDSVAFLERNSEQTWAILYASIGDVFIVTFLVPNVDLEPLNFEDIRGDTTCWQSGHVQINQWMIDGIQQPVTVADPVTESSSHTMRHAERLVFQRYFEYVKDAPNLPELSQKMVQALELHWYPPLNGYCRMNNRGDIETIISVQHIENLTRTDPGLVVLMRADVLHRCMDIWQSGLVRRFDFTRFDRDNMNFTTIDEQFEHQADALSYCCGLSATSSFANGVQVVKSSGRSPWMAADEERGHKKKEYATFICQDTKNNQITEHSCDERVLSNYFDPTSSKPFFISPVFFRPEVLQRFKSDSEKYTLELRTIHCRNSWSLRTYDINEAGQVHTYLGYLGHLPYEEQLYWKSFNEAPKAPISARAFKTDFEANWDDGYDPLRSLKNKIAKLDNKSPTWWQARPDDLDNRVQYPVTTSVDEWAGALHHLDQLLVEGFKVQGLRALLQSENMTTDKNWASLKLIEEVLKLRALSDSDINQSLAPLRRLHYLRSKTSGHATDIRSKLAAEELSKHQSLAAHFKSLVADCDMAFQKIAALLVGTQS
jgi:hypothetical protein